MATINIIAGGTQTITTSETDTVNFGGLSTLNVTGTAAAPIAVNISGLAGVGLLNTVNIENATVTLGGVAGASVATAFNIRAGGRLNLTSVANLAVGSAITFAGQNSVLGIAPGLNLSALSGIFGFAPGSAIDLPQSAASFTYADAAGNNTGGTITLRDTGGAVVGVVPISNGEYTAANFQISPDGTNGTLISFATAVTGVTVTPANADLGVGGQAVFNVATSVPVTVAGGTPTLTLNDGGVATYDAAASTALNLVFNHTVAAGQNTPDLAVTRLDLNGATINDVVGVALNTAGVAVNPAGTLQIDTLAPTVAGVVTNPGAGNLGAGQTVTLTVTTSEPVTVVGAPTLTLNDGGIATYVAGSSTPNSLVFTTTIAAGQNTPDLTVTGVIPNGATIRDGAGNAADLTAAVTNPAGVLVVDTTAPTVVGVTTNPGSGNLAAGQTVAITVTTSEPITVVGTPTLTLNDGGTATYDAAASTPSALVFTTTVAAGQNTPDLAVATFNPNGATVADAAGNAAVLTGAVTNPAGTLTIDTVAPTVTGVTTNPASGNLGIGQTVAITLATSEPVAVTGTPTLSLSNGGTATYDAAASTSGNLVFTTTVAAGQNTPDLTVTFVNLNGGSITDPAGNAADLTGASANPAGVLAIDGTAPLATGITVTPANATLGVGGVATFTVTTDEAVTVTGGTPSLTLNDGGVATYVAGSSTPTSLVFTTTVAAGQNTADLAVTAVNPNGATVADASGNAADLTAAVTNPAGVLVVDTTAPTVAGVTTNPGSGNLATGQTVAITVTTSEPVTVVGTPNLTLNDGGTATYDAAASTPSALVFTTTVAAGQNTPDLAVAAFNPNGAVITDAAGNAANLAGAITNPAGVLAVDTTIPTVAGVATSPGAGTVSAGQTVAITVTTSEPVAVTGTPTLTLSDGGTATYDPGASTSTGLVFTTTVAVGQTAPDLAVTAVDLASGSVTDPAGNAADLTGAVTNPAGVLVVDGNTPVVTGVTATPATAILGIGGTASITVTTNQPVTVAGGTPTLSLNDGGTATYDAALSTPTGLVFTTTVAAGQNAADLAVTGAALNGATVTSATGNALDLTPAAADPAGILQVDGTVPTVASVSTNPASGSLAAGQTVAITLGMSEAVSVAGGTPTLSLNDGGVATYDAAASTPTQLVFTTTVAPGQNVAGLAVTAVNLGVATIADPAGNPANLAGALGTLPGGLVVDTTAPTIPSITTNPGSGTVPAGTPIGITVGTSEPVVVNGGPPTLSLNNGGTAAYVPGSSTPTSLAFTYTTAPGDDVGDLAVTGLNLNGGSITDAAGNPATLTGAAVNPAGTLTVDTGIKPFAPLVVTSTDTAGAITVTAATRPFVAGTYSNLGTGTLSADGTTYTVTGTLAQVNAALQGVTLTPARGSAALAGYTATVSDTNTAASARLGNTGGLGSTLLAVTAGDAVQAGSGPDTLRGGSAAGTILVGGAGADVLVGSTAGGQLLGGTGSSTFFTTGGNSLVVGGGARDVISATGGTPTVFTAAGGNALVATGAGAAVVVGGGQDTVIGGTGSLLAGLATGTIAFNGSGPATYFASQGTTVVGGAGATLVGVKGTGALVFSGAGPTTFIGGTGSSTVIGGTGGGSALFAGAGGGLFGGGRGGNNTLVGGQGATTLFGGGNGDILYAGGSAGTVLVAGGGNETLQGAASSGNDLFYLGGGNTLVGLGAGQDVVYGGSGNATVVAGSGTDLFAFVNGQSGGTMSIVGFKAGTDKVTLGGYAANEAARATAAAVVTPGGPGTATSTTVTLSDNTRITFQGTGSLPANLFA